MNQLQKACQVLAGETTRSSGELFSELCPDYPVDPWGGAMGVAFDVAAACYLRGIHVPGYSPGAGGPEESEDPWTRELLAGLTDFQLGRLMKFLGRLTGGLRRAGRDY